MKTSTCAVVATFFASAIAFPQLAVRQGWTPQEWISPGPDDSRGPCPGLNTLANHGYLPRDGKDITLQILKDGMLDGFNIENSDAVLLFTQAIRTNPDYPRARSFDLDHLGRPGILEHDISLSRSDAYFADPNPFNETVWAETASFFTTDMITVDQLAAARMARLATSEATNPEHELSALADGFSWGECASFFEIMADGTTGTVQKDFIEYWFRKSSSVIITVRRGGGYILGKFLKRIGLTMYTLGNERMPTEIGWQRRNVTMQGSERVRWTRELMESAGVRKRK